MRKDELLVVRPDVAVEFPDGVPRWLRDVPVDQLRETMRLRDEGFALCGLSPGDDPDDLFEDGD